MIKYLVISLLICLTVFAQSPIPSNSLTIGPKQNTDKKIFFNRNASAKPTIKWNESTGSLQFSNDGVSFIDIGSGSGGGGGFNLITSNPEFESGISQGWAATAGSFTAATSGANLLFGKGSAVWDASATGQFVRSDAYALPSGLTDSGRTCQVSMFYKGGDANLLLHAVDSSNTEITGSSVTLAAATSTTFIYQTFPCPSSGSMKLELKSTADAASVAFDRMYLGEMALTTQVSQASFYGSLRYDTASSCLWTITQTSFLADYAADTDCPTPTVTGNASAPGTKVPQINFTSLPPGSYQVSVNATLGNNGGAADLCSWILVDEVGNAIGKWSSRGEGAGGSVIWPVTLSGVYTNTNAGAHNFKLQGACDTGNARIYNDNSGGLGFQELRFNVVRLPTSQDQVFRADQVANSWSGYTTVSGGCSTTSSTYADTSSCTSIAVTESVNRNFGTVTTAASSLPGITFTPSRVGTYAVCANMTLFSSSGSATVSARLIDSNASVINPGVSSLQATSSNDLHMTLCGLAQATSTSAFTIKAQLATNTGTVSLVNGQAAGSASITWTIFQIDQKLPAPILVGGVTTDLTGGVEKLCRATIAESAACSSSPCTITRQSGCISSVTRSGTGQYTVNFVGSSFSSAPSCHINNGTGSNEATITSSITTSSFNINLGNNGASADGQNFQILCMGPK